MIGVGECAAIRQTLIAWNETDVDGFCRLNNFSPLYKPVARTTG
jgi:hypothetical protein